MKALMTDSETPSRPYAWETAIQGGKKEFCHKIGRYRAPKLAIMEKPPLLHMESSPLILRRAEFLLANAFFAASLSLKQLGLRRNMRTLCLRVRLKCIDQERRSKAVIS